jgi:hypothetical protein
MNTTLTSNVIAKESMRAFVTQLGLASDIDMQYKNEFAQSGAKAGATVNVRKPARFVVSTGQALALQDVLDETSPLTIQYQDHVDFQFSSSDLALNIDQFSERYLKPAGAALAAKFNSRVADLYTKFADYAGLPGTVPTAILTYSNARTALSLAGAPDDGQRVVVINSNMHAQIVNELKGLLQPSSIGNQLKRGVIAQAVGFNWREDNNIATHTVGQLGGTPLVNGANQFGSTIVTDAWTGTSLNRLKKGDIVQFAGCYSVNPLTYLSTGVLKNFVVTADMSDVAGAGTIPISPAIVLSGPTQNVSNAPADNAAVTIFGHASTYASKVSPQGLAFHPKAFTAAFVDLPLPRGADMAARISDADLGISMRVWRDGDINTDQFPCRIDILYGLDSLRPEWGTRVCA